MPDEPPRCPRRRVVGRMTGAPHPDDQAAVDQCREVAPGARCAQQWVSLCGPTDLAPIEGTAEREQHPEEGLPTHPGRVPRDLRG
jgi:hypothetical protein